MLPIRNILAPIDFTASSDLVLDTAFELAKQFGASVTILHAYQIPVYGFPEGSIIAGAEYATELSTIAQQKLDATVVLRQASGVALKAVLREGSAWEEVEAVAREEKADLIVIATHGRHGLARALLGSVAEKIVRTATVPVLTIRGAHDGS